MMNTKISLIRRLASMLLDHIIMTFIIVTILTPFLLEDINQIGTGKLNFGSNSMLTIIGSLFIYFCKDCFGGQSIAKRLLKLQIIDIDTGLKASALKCFIRNIFCILWPIEVIVTFSNINRRIGDKVAGTEVVNAI